MWSFASQWRAGTGTSTSCAGEEVCRRLLLASPELKLVPLCRESDKPKYCVELPSHPVGLVRVGKNMLVGCTDESLQGFTQKVTQT